MSLIEVWRDRRQTAPGPTRPPRLWKLVAALIVVAIVMWRLSQFL